VDAEGEDCGFAARKNLVSWRLGGSNFLFSDCELNAREEA